MKTVLPKFESGFSLVDLMVGMVIAMLGIVIIFQVFAVSESVKRTTTGGNDAQQAGAFSLVSLQGSLKFAGYGLFTKPSASSYPKDNAASAPPVVLGLSANSSVPDTVTVVYRQNWDYGQFYDSTYVSAVPPAPVVETYYIDNTNVPPTRNNTAGKLQLVVQDTSLPTTSYTTSGSPVNTNNVLADGIVMLKAEYGTDANDDGIVQSTEWSAAQPTDYWKVKAVRMVIVARSAQPEKPDANGNCNTTVNPPTWSGSTNRPLSLTNQADLVAAGDDWKCYRYKSYETVVPLRNVMWH